MADYLKTFVDSTLEDVIKQKYPHIKKPSLVLAKIVELEKKDTNSLLTLSVLDKDMNEDQTYPKIPYVVTTCNVSMWDVVVVGMLYGDCIPYVLGRYPDEH